MMSDSDFFDFSIYSDTPLRIQSKSVENAIAPLSNQVSRLIQVAGELVPSDPSLLAERSEGIVASLAKFVSVCQLVAQQNEAIAQDLTSTCTEINKTAQAMSAIICNLDANTSDPSATRQKLVFTCKSLLSSFTKALILADSIKVSSILSSRDELLKQLEQIQGVTVFTELLTKFGDFGNGMVKLAHMTGERQLDMKDESKSAQLSIARAILEKSTMMLLTTCKAKLRHPECQAASDLRDHVLTQMRSALSMVQDSVAMEVESKSDEDLYIWLLVKNLKLRLLHLHSPPGEDSECGRGGVLAQIVDMAQLLRHKTQTLLAQSSLPSSEQKTAIRSSLEEIYTSLPQLEEAHFNFCREKEAQVSSEECFHESSIVNKTLTCLGHKIEETALQLSAHALTTAADAYCIQSLRDSASCGDTSSVSAHCERMRLVSEHLQEMCKFLIHIAVTPTLRTTSLHTESCILVYGKMVMLSAAQLSAHPSSKIAQEIFELMSDAWETQMRDLSLLVRDVTNVLQGKMAIGVDASSYASLPKPGEQANIARVSLTLKLETEQLTLEVESLQQIKSFASCDVLRRSSNICRMALALYQFTRAQGPLATSSDFFSQLHFLVEECHKICSGMQSASSKLPAVSSASTLTYQEFVEFGAHVGRFPLDIKQLYQVLRTPCVVYEKVEKCLAEAVTVVRALYKLLVSLSKLTKLLHLDPGSLFVSAPGGDLSPVETVGGTPRLSLHRRQNSLDSTLILGNGKRPVVPVEKTVPSTSSPAPAKPNTGALSSPVLTRSKEEAKLSSTSSPVPDKAPSPSSSSNSSVSGSLGPKDDKQPSNKIDCEIQQGATSQIPTMASSVLSYVKKAVPASPKRAPKVLPGDQAGIKPKTPGTPQRQRTATFERL